MKKNIFIFCMAVLAASCNQQTNSSQQLQLQVDSLKLQVSKTYKPGLGEFMSSIQVHHAKLWFAGNAQNWELADFEVHEIMESLDDIQQYETERPEAKNVMMLQPALDSINDAIKQKNLLQFKNGFALLTNTCNNCHKAVHYGFNMVKIPDAPPFSNQVFKMQEHK